MFLYALLIQSSSLEFNIHQLILTDLAANIGESKEDAHTQEYLTAIDHVTSKVETRAVSDEKEDKGINGDVINGDNGDAAMQRVFMVRTAQLSWLFVLLSSVKSNSRIHCNIGFAELAVNLPNAHVDATVPVLVDILQIGRAHV